MAHIKLIIYFTGEYGMEDVCFSLPVRFKHKKYEIVKDLVIPDHLWAKLKDIVAKFNNVS